MHDVIIGKYTLESLTSGMYADPYVIFREYVQNAVDSIDSAIAAGILQTGEEKIVIDLSLLEHKISVTDNGSGIPSPDAIKTLVSIGNSSKDFNKSRGFRGIGRLAGLSYCNTLIFETTAVGENVGTRITIDSKRLAEILSSTNSKDMTVADVLTEICFVEAFQEQNASHYFKVVLLDVDNAADLLNSNAVYDYISQTCPVPFSPETFQWGAEIHRRLATHQYALPEYKICLSQGPDIKDIYKPYCDKFCVDKKNGEVDKIQDIDLVRLNDSDSRPMAIAWIAKTRFLGTIPDKRIKGIRLRKGNMSIGDNQTLNVMFKDARFNGWSMGEIYVLDSKLLPNARRDNFEKNPTYFLFTEQLMSLASSLVKEIRATSVKRNSELAAAIKKVQESGTAVDIAVENGVNPAEKGSLTQKTGRAKQALHNMKSNDSHDAYLQEIAFEELDIIIGKLQGITAFKALNTIEGLTKTEKIILERVFKIIVSHDEAASTELIDNILNEFSKK